MPTTQTKACLRVDGDHGSAAQISEAIGLLPTSSHDIGSPRSARDPRPWPHTQWALDSGLPGSADLEQHLTALCDVVAPRATALRGLQEAGFRMDWFCFVGIAGGQGGVVLSPYLLARLAELPAALDVDIYRI